MSCGCRSSWSRRLDFSAMTFLVPSSTLFLGLCLPKKPHPLIFKKSESLSEAATDLRFSTVRAEMSTVLPHGHKPAAVQTWLDKWQKLSFTEEAPSCSLYQRGFARKSLGGAVLFASLALESFQMHSTLCTNQTGLKSHLVCVLELLLIPLYNK